jgi:hypothetical protein
MIFSSEQPIDDILIDLVKRVKRETKKTPVLNWVAEKNIWRLEIKDWLNQPVFIFYCPLHKNKFSVQAESWMFSSDHSTAKGAIDHLHIERLAEKEVSNNILSFLVEKLTEDSLTMKKAIELLAIEPGIDISPREMEILKTPEKLRGTIHGKRFGI